MEIYIVISKRTLVWWRHPLKQYCNTTAAQASWCYKNKVIRLNWDKPMMSRNKKKWRWSISACLFSCKSHGKLSFCLEISLKIHEMWYKGSHLLCVTFSFYIRWQFPTVKCLTRPCWHKALPSKCTAFMRVRCCCNYTKLKRIHPSVAPKIRFAKLFLYKIRIWQFVPSFHIYPTYVRNMNWSLGHLVPHFNPLLIEFLLRDI